VAHHLVRYLKHARRELLRALDGLDPTAVDLRLGGLNSPTWVVGHLTQQEQRLFLTPRGEPEVADLSPYGSGAPVMLEPLHDIEMLLEFKRAVAEAVDPWLDTLTAEDLLQHLPGGGVFERENVGSLLTRTTHHVYFHIGQISVVHKLLGYPVPSFVGSQRGATFDLAP